jgi:PAS domain S-box-containing protein
VNFGGDFEQLVTLSRDMICIHEPDGSYLFVSPASYEITGYSPDELLGRNPYDFFHPEDREAILSGSHKPAQLGDDTVRIAYRFVHKDGHAVWLETLTRPVLDESGQVVRLHTTSRDISDAVEQRTRIQEQNTLLSMGQALSGIGSWEVDLLTNQVNWSRGIRKIHDLDDDTALTVADVLNFYINESREVAETRLGLIMSDGVGFDEKLQVRTARGREIWTRVIGAVEQVDGKPVRVYGVCQDIDREYRHQRELQQMVDVLTSRNRQMEEVHRMLSHNMKGPAGNIGILIDTLKASASVDPQLLEMLRENANLMSGTIDKMSELISASTIVAKPDSPRSLRDSWEKARRILDARVEECGARIDVDFSEAPALRYPELYLDSYFYNFVSNAIKYRDPSRKPEISIRSQLSGADVYLIFEDNGMGIDLAKYRDRLFALNQRFHPRRPDSQEPIEGSGLGLFMCKNQLESMGGGIEVHSEVGQGTRFSLRLGSREELF